MVESLSSTFFRSGRSIVVYIFHCIRAMVTNGRGTQVNHALDGSSSLNSARRSPLHVCSGRLTFSASDTQVDRVAE